jgi:hypothetical protein
LIRPAELAGTTIAPGALLRGRVMQAARLKRPRQRDVSILAFRLETLTAELLERTVNLRLSHVIWPGASRGISYSNGDEGVILRFQGVPLRIAPGTRFFWMTQ